jgi:hypothetical protein
MKIVYVDMDSVLVNFQSGIDALTDEQRQTFKDDLDEYFDGEVTVDDLISKI